MVVALHLADELRTAAPQASNDGVDVADRECDMADARGVRRRVPVAAPPQPGDAAAGGSTNGWTFWIADTTDGRFTLAALREQLVARQQ